MIELKIPKDPKVLLAVSAWLAKQAGASVHMAHDETVVEVPRVSEQDIRRAMLDQVLPPAATASAPSATLSTWQAASAHPGDLTPAQAFGTPPPPPVTGGSVNINAPSPGPDVGEFGTEIQNVAPQLDGRGYPWDARIHSSSKALLAKAPHGWKPLRGVPPALAEQVEAELRAQGFGKTPNPSAAAAVPVRGVPPAPTLAASFPPSEAFPAAAAAPALTDFSQVMARVGNANKLPDAQALLGAYNLPSFPALAAKPDLWPGFLQALGV
jgi:hypothetical protein